MSKGENMVERCHLVALLSLAQSNVPVDMQELLLQGNPMRDIAPHALRKAVRAVIEALMEHQTPEMLNAGGAATDYDDFNEAFNARVAGRVFQAMLRTILSQPNDEGEGK